MESALDIDYLELRKFYIVPERKLNLYLHPYLILTSFSRTVPLNPEPDFNNSFHTFRPFVCIQYISTLLHTPPLLLLSIPRSCYPSRPRSFPLLYFTQLLLSFQTKILPPTLLYVDPAILLDLDPSPYSTLPSSCYPSRQRSFPLLCYTQILLSFQTQILPPTLLQLAPAILLDPDPSLFSVIPRSCYPSRPRSYPLLCFTQLLLSFQTKILPPTMLYLDPAILLDLDPSPYSVIRRICYPFRPIYFPLLCYTQFLLSFQTQFLPPTLLYLYPPILPDLDTSSYTASRYFYLSGTMSLLLHLNPSIFLTIYS